MCALVCSKRRQHIRTPDIFITNTENEETASQVNMALLHDFRQYDIKMPWKQFQYVFPLSKCLWQGKIKEIIPMVWIFTCKYLLESIRFYIQQTQTSNKEQYCLTLLYSNGLLGLIPSLTVCMTEQQNSIYNNMGTNLSEATHKNFFLFFPTFLTLLH